MMHHLIKTVLAVTCILLCPNLNAQVGGNQVYQNKSINYNRNPVQTKSIYSTDSTLVVKSTVLLNKAADYYLLTIGVNSIAKTVIEANQITNNRIQRVTEKIKKMGINKEDIYIDFIAETKMYDHTVDGNKINEFFDGFSVRKNLIIKTDQITNIDEIIDYCSEEEIYDIIKVDYRSEDLEKINDDLFDEALKISKKKTQRFSRNSSVRLGSNRITSEVFSVYYPKNLYKQYNEAFETSTLNYYSGSYIKKEVRKERTFYYDGVETEVGVDKIIDEITPIVGIQYVMEVVITYDLVN